jgi:hypothetical protein
VENSTAAPRALLVLGMHRSGTSAVAGALRLRGFALGRDLMLPAADNPKGFWEHAGVVAIHERLLSALGRAWNDPRPLPENWAQGEAAAVAAAELGTLLRDEFAGCPLWAVKDPRLCRLLPLWLPVLERMGVQPAVLLVMRDPHEVAASLSARNQWPEGLSRLLWIQHLLDAEQFSRGLDRTVLPYLALLQTPQQALEAVLHALHLPLPLPPVDYAGAVAAFIAASDRHHVAHEQAGEAWELPLAMYRVMGAGDDNPWHKLEPLRTRFGQAEALYAQALEGYAQVAVAEQQLREQAQAQAQAQVQAVNAENQQRGELIVGLDAQLQALGQAHRDLQAEYEQQQQQLLHEMQISRQLGAQLQDVLNSRSWKLTRPLRFAARLLRGE